MISIEAFQDELEKLAALDSQGERRQFAQFAALGTVAAPVVSGIKNYITHGKVSPLSSFKRWLPAQMVGGALMGGVLPAARHLIERDNVKAVQDKRKVQRELIQAKNFGIPRMTNTHA